MDINDVDFWMNNDNLKPIKKRIETHRRIVGRRCMFEIRTWDRGNFCVFYTRIPAAVAVAADACSRAHVFHPRYLHRMRM